MAESEEMVKLVEGAYKNILEKFNPCARQLINAGKSYLKALHGCLSSSKTYIDIMTKLARHAHQGTWGGSTDIGTALMQLVDVHKEIQAQQTNILKAFYVDLLVPLEINLEKDVKIVASEQKKFVQQHKLQQEAYLKALTLFKKHKKKSRTSKDGVVDKETKQLQTVEEERAKLDCFCAQSLKQAITQERRRYGFILERQCSLAKHYLAYHTKGEALLTHQLHQWQEVVKTREILPDTMNKLFPVLALDAKIEQNYPLCNLQVTSDPEDDVTYGVRKTRSIDASYLNLQELQETSYARPLSRAKSDFNLPSSSASLVSSDYGTPVRPKSIVGTDNERKQRVRAVYSYLSSGENQLSFHEGDIISLIGERNKGWQYGENLRNHRFGWFPIAYTEHEENDKTDKNENRTLIERRDNKDTSSYSPSTHNRPFSQRPVSFSFDSRLVDIASGLTVPKQNRPLSTFADILLTKVGDNSKQDSSPKTDTSPRTSGPRCNKYIGKEDPIKLPTILRVPRRSATSPAVGFLPSFRCPLSTSLHSSSDSGFCNDSGHGNPLSEGSEEESRSITIPNEYSVGKRIPLLIILQIEQNYPLCNLQVTSDPEDDVTYGVRKTRSIDASYLNLQELQETSYARPLSRAKSDFNLPSSSASLVSSDYGTPVRPKSIVGTDNERKQRVRAVYSYLSSGENQLSFHEGDIISLIGERNKGWQYGENLRNHRFGWFPIAYTEHEENDKTDKNENRTPIIERRDNKDTSSYSPSTHNRPFSQRPVSFSFDSRLVDIASGLTVPKQNRPLSTFADILLTKVGDNSKQDSSPKTDTSPRTSGPRCNKYIGKEDPIKLPTILRVPRRSATSPAVGFLPSFRCPLSTSLHSSSDSGFCNDSGHGNPLSEGSEEESRSITIPNE
ncbi:uncharacterized protein LOC111613387 [Centruroides sculpturatus]|uniref:uncharacterized protein LOC111613387 n=1 Tax=Centruroides sculpturatus TaxID=218467 RepID=UPI000C6EE2C9|nr:uncharacterized protein LOC111613387 [Centruroides sculpturatus]